MQDIPDIPDIPPFVICNCNRFDRFDFTIDSIDLRWSCLGGQPCYFRGPLPAKPVSGGGCSREARASPLDLEAEDFIRAADFAKLYRKIGRPAPCK